MAATSDGPELLMLSDRRLLSFSRTLSLGLTPRQETSADFQSPPTPPPKVLTKKRKNQMIKEPLCIYKPVNFARRFKALKNPKHLFEIFYTNWFCNTKKKNPEIKYLDFSEVRHSNSSRQECWRGGGNPIFKFDRNKFFLFLLIGRETRLHSYFCPWL